MEDRHSEFNRAVSYPPPAQPGAFHVDAAAYAALYARSIADPDGFWGEQARSTLSWFRDFKEVRGGGFTDGDVRWFSEGQLNVCYNCVDRACLRKGARQLQGAPRSCWGRRSLAQLTGAAPAPRPSSLFLLSLSTIHLPFLSPISLCPRLGSH